MTTIVVLTAPEGARTHTRIAQAKRRLSVDLISAKELLNQKIINNYNEEADGLTLDELMMQNLVEKINANDKEFIILEGVPKNIQQAELMRKFGINVDVVISLPFPNGFQKKSMKLYRKEMGPVLMHYISKGIPFKEVLPHEKDTVFIHALMY